MKLTLTCSICKGPLEIEEEAVREAMELGAAINPQHEVCPNQLVTKEVTRRFKVYVKVYEVFPDLNDEELLTKFGGEYEGTSFEATLPKLQAELNKGWEQVQKMASVIDQS